MSTAGRSLPKLETTYKSSFRLCSKVIPWSYRDLRERAIGKIKRVLRLKLVGDLFGSGQGLTVDGQGQTAAEGDAANRGSNNVVALIIPPSSFPKNG